jgi:hypothetical protein
MKDLQMMVTRRSILTALFSLAIAAMPSAGRAAIVGYTNDNSSLCTVDLTTGAVTVIGALGVSGDFESMAFDPTTGVLYAYDDFGGGLYTVNTTTGALTSVGGSTTLNNGGMSIDSSGQAYLVEGSGRLYSLNLGTGATTLVGTSSPGTSSAAFVGTVLYAAGDNGSTNSLQIVNTATGAKTTVGPMGLTIAQQAGMSYDASNDTLYLVNESTSSLYSVNRVTGAASLIASYSVPSSNPFESLAISPASVPEPATLAIWGTFAGLGLVASRRRRKQPA